MDPSPARRRERVRRAGALPTCVVRPHRHVRDVRRHSIGDAPGRPRVAAAAGHDGHRGTHSVRRRRTGARHHHQVVVQRYASALTDRASPGRRRGPHRPSPPRVARSRSRNPGRGTRPPRGTCGRPAGGRLSARRQPARRAVSSGGGRRSAETRGPGVPVAS
ncbi:hypothetical protein STXM2123_5557 [Streptomyces sp. F-3]|nr:hypothetical protein STXM2123_5557 [Streptomyces sp. F-3]